MKLFIIGLVLITFVSYGQIPEGYYDGTEGLSGQALRGALQEIIDDHQVQSYSSIWTHFQTTDDDIDGMVWDMYSDVPGGNPAYTYAFIEDQCGNYSNEGDCYNREHSFPKSWFNDAEPMVTDLFHIYPTDGFVNGKRSNYPYGVVGSAVWISTNGSRLGNCSYAGYSGTVFEPVDEYKGDFARTFFYMMARYMDMVGSWNSDMLDGNDLTNWAKEMLLEWGEYDPVSQKEIDRNEAVFLVQNNRNPFIDHPEFSGLIWDEQSSLDNIENLKVKFSNSMNNIHIDNPYNISGWIHIYSVLGLPLGTWEINNKYTDIQLNNENGIYILVFCSSIGYQSYKFSILHK
jgi:endonuclease I